ncbi:unnamed protein product [Rhizophagus irregularis]|uniref:Methyltransferase domain-containing protein n=2 Tax=Rhizophagus irregularis TaxID=588596 RepID=A0A915ZKI0_9GLOM|nr:hypothetical protein RirG_231170 [Rhizophagus irregularis DAOM 197198w]UZO24384.1 hypothetical protein OCT59_016686 [Rhizophagus irregularis]GET52995.1 S-adenosyl-L-methionine-dependent methyltransferase [Rhizophagus irregularis DAOM 181602=DAOM 197198]CAB4397869.1 unnamed protein product [Rhizophagus irregularis]CAB4404058.1 unnamed protein product [Rhizophagus irregularis]
MGQGLTKRIKRKRSLISQQRSIESDTDSNSNISTKIVLQENERTSIYFTYLRGLFNSDFSAPIEDVLILNGKIMETACGSGSWLIDMALRYPNSEFIGLDLNPSPLPTNLPKNTSFIKGNLQSIPYEDEEFDFLKTGELQVDFTEVEYKHAIDEMIRVTKRGGWVEINEPDIYPLRHAPNYAKIVESFYGLLALRGISVMTDKLQYMLYSTNSLQDIQFDCKIINVGPQGGELGNQCAEVYTIYFKDLYGQELADHLGLTYDEYLQTLWKNAEEEMNNSCIEIRYYRFWGQKR